MFITAIFAFLFIHQDPNLYRESFKKSAEATYVGSDLKYNVELVHNKIRENYPIVTTVIPIAYTITNKKEYRFTSRKITPLKNTVTTYEWNLNNNSGKVVVSIPF